MKIVTVFLFLAGLLLATSSHAQDIAFLVCSGEKLGGSIQTPISASQCAQLKGACCAFDDPDGKVGISLSPSDASLWSIDCLGCFSIGELYVAPVTPLCTGSILNPPGAILNDECISMKGQCCSTDPQGGNGAIPSSSPGGYCPYCWSGEPKMP